MADDYEAEWAAYRVGKRIPRFSDSQLDWNLPDWIVDIDILEICADSLREKGLHNNAVYLNRLLDEYSLIESRGMLPLIRAVLHLKHGIDEAGCVLSAGRGSSCASLLLYLLGINALDPIEWGLGFDYFLPANRPEKKPDVDLEVVERKSIISRFKEHSPVGAMKLEEKEGFGDRLFMVKHASGLYFQNIPLRGGRAAYPHKIAKDFGFLKIDLLNSRAYSMVDGIEDRDRLISFSTSSKFPWSSLSKYDHHFSTLADDGDTVLRTGQLTQLHKRRDLLRRYSDSVRSIEDLAILLALVRPAKKKMIGKSWDYISERIWDNDNGDDPAYAFKRPHAVATAVNVCVHFLCLLRRDGA